MQQFHVNLNCNLCLTSLHLTFVTFLMPIAFFFLSVDLVAAFFIEYDCVGKKKITVLIFFSSTFESHQLSRQEGIWGGQPGTCFASLCLLADVN